MITGEPNANHIMTRTGPEVYQIGGKETNIYDTQSIRNNTLFRFQYRYSWNEKLPQVLQYSKFSLNCHHLFLRNRTQL